jgi:hypothetical protein
VEALNTAEEIALAAEDAAAAAQLGSVAETSKHRDRAQAAFTRLGHLASSARGSLSDAHIDVDELVGDSQLSLESATAAVGKAKDRVVGVRVRVIVAGAVLILCETLIVLLGSVPSLLHFLMLLAMGTLLAGGAVAVGWRTRGFALFGASLFIAVLLFGTAVTLFRTWDHPKLQPIALLRSGSDSGMTGFYITETTDSVYLARLNAQAVRNGRPFEETLPHILIVPRSSVVAISIGPLMERRAGVGVAEQLLNELCMDKVTEPIASESGSAQGTAASAPGTKSTGGTPRVASKNPCPPS